MTDTGNVPKPELHYYDMAREIVRRVRHRAHLSDDEIIVLAMVAAQISFSAICRAAPRIGPRRHLEC